MPIKWTTILNNQLDNDDSVVVNDCVSCAQLFKSLDKFFNDLVIEEHVSISKVYAEMPHGGSKSSRAVRCMSLATGVVMSFLTANNLMPVIITPTEVKCVYNLSDKNDIMAAVRKEQPHIKWPIVKKRFEHIADAYCAIKAGLLREQL